MLHEETPVQTITLRRSDEEFHGRKIIIRRSPQKMVKGTQKRDNVDRTLASLIAAGAIVVMGIMGYTQYTDKKLVNEYDSLPRTNIVSQAGNTYDKISASLIPTEKFHQELRQDWGMRKYGNLSLRVGEIRAYPYDPIYLEKKSQRAR